MAKQNKPAIRFKGFTDAWEQRKLGEISEIKTGPFGSTLHADDYVSEGVPIITTEHFKTGSLPQSASGLPQVSEVDYKRLSAYTLNNGDIVFSRVGSVDINALVTPFQRNWLFSGRVLRVRPGIDVLPQFLHTRLETESIRNDICARAVGQTMPSINTEILKATQLVLPTSMAEQKQIGLYFAKLDHLITLHQRKYDKLQVLKKAMLEKMFPKNGSSVPEIRFKGFTDAWEQRKLGEVVERITRKNENLESTLPLTISAQHGLINQNEFFDKRIASKDVSGYFLVRNGEFAYNKSTSSDAPWGAIKRLDRYESGVLSTLYIVFKISDERKTSSDYIVTYYNTDLWHKGIQAIAAEGARNHGLLNVAPADFFETNLTMPKDYAEQQQIGSFFQQLDHLITLHQRELEKLQNIKKSMLEKMFV